MKLRAESEEFLNLDCLRIIAATAVIIYHFRRQWFLGPTWLVSNLDGLNLFVDVFFCISGVIIARVYGGMRTLADYGRFLQRRLARLGPLHWATLLIYIVIGLAAAKFGIDVKDAGKYDAGCVVPNILLLHSLGLCHGVSFNFVSWSISAEMAAYVVFPLLLFVAIRRAWMLLLAAGAGLLALYLISPPSRPWWEWTYDFGAARALVGFPIGMALYAYRKELGRWIPPWTAWAAFGLFLGLIISGAPKGFVAPLAYVLVAATVAADGKSSPGWVHALSPWGQLTFGTYMLHPLVRTLMIALVGKKLLHLGGLGLSALAVVDIPLTFLAAWLSLFLFETPARRWIGSLGYRSRSASTTLKPA